MPQTVQNRCQQACLSLQCKLQQRIPYFKAGLKVGPAGPHPSRIASKVIRSSGITMGKASPARYVGYEL